MAAPGRHTKDVNGLRVGVIGIGSNSVRLLVADVLGGHLVTVLRDRRGTRLFAGLTQGSLSPQSMEAACTAVCEMVGAARGLGAAHLYGFATSAVRDALNREVFLAMVQAQASLALETLSGEQEAHYSYWGAACPGLCGMIDIGGGSTEVTIGRDGHPLTAVSLQLGCVRLFRQVPIARRSELAQAIQVARPLLEGSLGALMAHGKPDAWVGVGGTMTTLAAMDMKLATFDRALVSGHVLFHDRVLSLGEQLADMTLAQRAALPGLQPQRADIVVHGVAILLAAMEALGIDALVASDHGNLDGFLQKKVSQIA